MANKKRIYEEAFEHKKLQCIKVDDFYVEHTVYKVIKKQEYPDVSYSIKTAQNCNFMYGESVIKGTAASATSYTCEKKATKSELIELFSKLSMNDIWFATYLTQDKDKNWQEELAMKIQSMSKDDAVKYIKKDFTTFGKSSRELAGQKSSLHSDNNYYMVRDLNIYFEELKTNDPTIAAKNSIRLLDVNTLQSLIFNNVKYILK